MSGAGDAAGQSVRMQGGGQHLWWHWARPVGCLAPSKGVAEESSTALEPTLRVV